MKCVMREVRDNPKLEIDRLVRGYRQGIFFWLINERVWSQLIHRVQNSVFDALADSQEQR